jgi:DNA-binding transcriptional LysR family regulator
MNDLQIRCFLAAADMQNFTKAAEALYLSQPVLGRHISNLETELGFTLFHRERKAVRLTDNGRIFQQFLLKCQEQYKSAMDKIFANLRSDSMSLRLGTAEGQLIGDTYSDAFRYLINYEPRIKLNIMYYLNPRLYDAVIGGEIDACIAALNDILPYSNYLDYKKLKKIHTGLVVPITHPATSKAHIDPSDFKNEQFILLSENESPLAKELQMETMRSIGITKYIVAPISQLYLYGQKRA